MARAQTGEGNGGAATPPRGSRGGTQVGGGNGAGVAAVSMKDNPEVRSAVAQAFERIKELEDQRRDINAQIKAEREGLVSRGLNKQALKDAERYCKLDETQRQGYDESLAISRKAMSLPIQPGLFGGDNGGGGAQPTH